VLHEVGQRHARKFCRPAQRQALALVQGGRRANLTPGSDSSVSLSRWTSTASGSWRLSTTTGSSRAMRSASEGLFFNCLTVTVFIMFLFVVGT
jgi:hypothetical protein